MPLADPPPTPPTAEFIALCQAQLALLVQALRADWCAVYLRAGVGPAEEADLIPIATYPPTNSGQQAGMALPLLPQVGEQLPPNAPQISAPTGAAPLSSSGERLNWQSQEKGAAEQPMVFPLLDDKAGEVIGVLVAGRRNRPWNEKELGQIQAIARTLALAHLLERRQLWHQQQASQQERIRELERERLDDLLHQLRNPLTALRTFSKLLLKRLLPEDPDRPAIQGIARESDRLQELLQEFEADLEAMVAEAGVVTLEATPALLAGATPLLVSPALPLEPVAVSEILTPLLLSYQAIAQERGLTFKADIPPDLPPVRGNASALREVFSNLIDNGLKYTPPGGTVQVKAGLVQGKGEGQWQGTAIRDTGAGIPVGDREHIFQRHYRGVQAEGDIPGTGLGLAIVKDLVERMQGKIELAEGSLPGTTFIVWLPPSS